ncbi:unnamed protein product, partial [Sphacelaria rigidula]
MKHRGEVSGRGDDSEEWIPDTGASHHTTGNMEGIFDVRVPPHGNENVILGYGTVLPVRTIDRLNLRFYIGLTDGAERTSVCVKLTNMCVLDGIKFNLLSSHQVQYKQDTNL